MSTISIMPNIKPMKNFKLSVLLFVLFVYENYIKENDIELLNSVGKFFIYPVWFIHSCLVWLFLPVFVPVYIVQTSTVYKQTRVIMDSPEYHAHMQKMMKKFGLGGF